ncbi:MAG: NADH-quinone oxidoreductase subunit NuoF [bacterium]|nr:NADH-quinone oxidoreductase subunit NuoF [bacterium]
MNLDEEIKDDRVQILVCLGTGGQAAGGDAVIHKFEEEVKKHHIDAVVQKPCVVSKSGCRGLCAKDLLVDIIMPGKGQHTYMKVTKEMVVRIVEEDILQGNPIQEWLVTDDYHKFYDTQVRNILSRCGKIDPENIDEYISHGGYKALRKVLFEMTPDEVIEVITNSKLRGRGGAGFPTGMKWSFAKMAQAEHKYVVVNADEGDPGAFMDRSVLEGDPHSVIEGLIIAAYTMGATHGYFYARAEYPLAIKRLGIALEQAREKNLLGKNILGKDFNFDIEIKEGAGAFVCGEETALMESIEGKRGMPRIRPPFPARKGLWESPTNINNVKTYANIPLIINKGAEWYLNLGTKKSPGTAIFALTGKIKNTGLVEVPMGMTLRAIIFDICGGMSGKNRKFKAAQLGGPSGGCLPESLLDTPIDFDSLTAAGAMMGSGGIVVMDDTTCMVDMARFFLQFTQNESCGKCTPCRIGTRAMLEILTRITEGRGQPNDMDLLADMAGDIKMASLCGLGQTAPNPVLSTLRYFRDEYEAHIIEKRCPASSCVNLLKFEVNPKLCKMCGICMKNCPTQAVIWEKKTVARIDKPKCIKCRTCIDVCPFRAIG